jgi:hypothetical protein
MLVFFLFSFADGLLRLLISLALNTLLPDQAIPARQIFRRLIASAFPVGFARMPLPQPIVQGN